MARWDGTGCGNSARPFPVLVARIPKAHLETATTFPVTETMWKALYIVCMALGALLFVTWSRQPRGGLASEYLIATAIPVWSGLAYLALLLGQGTVEVDGQTTCDARYIDWAITTPLLTSLALTAMFRQTKKDYTLIAALIFIDLVMIGSGLVADLSTGSARTLWFLCGVVGFSIVDLAGLSGLRLTEAAAWFSAIKFH